MKAFFQNTRRACVLQPLFSLRSDSDFGVGEIPDLVDFCRWAQQAGFAAVQLLPFHEVWQDETSPYSALTAFGLDPVYLSLNRCEDFVAAGGESALGPEGQKELAALRNAETVQWRRVRTLKGLGLRAAFNHYKAEHWRPQGPRAQALKDFCARENHWLADYCLYFALADVHGPDWSQWPQELTERQDAAIKHAHTVHADAILWRQYLQWQLDLQWKSARADAHELGVELAGDLPFVVSRDAADVWAHQGDFHKNLRLGVPPDAFSEDGQDWGLPVYDWEAIAANGYQWFRARAHRAASLCSLWRVDHVIGLFRSYYRRNDGGAAGFTPPQEDEQVALGQRTLAVLQEAGEIVAEDLGAVPNYMRPCLDKMGIPGFRVLRWEQKDGVFSDPATWPTISVATTGTHDNESSAEWFEETMSRDEREAFLRLPGLQRFAGSIAYSDEIRDEILRVVYQSPSVLAVLPFVDLLGGRQRINKPGTLGDHNWTYRMSQSIESLMRDEALSARLRSLAAQSQRRT